MKKSSRQKIKNPPLTGVYPGTFDPVTLGHLDIIERALKVVDHLVIGVADNPAKNPLFSITERVALMQTDIANNKKFKGKSIEVVPFSKLLMHFVQEMGARVIVRGLRAVSDFEFEFQMALMNRRLNPAIETVFMMPGEQYTYISSRLIKEVAALGGRVHGLVPDLVEARLRDKQNRP